MATVPHEEVRVIIGVDTHEDVHVAVALDQLGRWLGELSIPTHTGGYKRLVDWTSEFGVIDRVGVEGTGSWGAGLSRWLRAEGLVVVEVDRPDRKSRRHGKSDTIDAEAAARAVLSGKATTVPKTADGPVEMIRVLRLTRRSALKNRTMTANPDQRVDHHRTRGAQGPAACLEHPTTCRGGGEVPHRRGAR